MRTLILLLALVLMPLMQIQAVDSEVYKKVDASVRNSYVIGRITPNNPILTTSIYPPNNTPFSIRVQNAGTTNQVMLSYQLQHNYPIYNLNGYLYTSSEADSINVGEGQYCDNNVWFVTIRIPEGYEYQFNSINVILEY